jgi:hypothetical protein
MESACTTDNKNFEVRNIVVTEGGGSLDDNVMLRTIFQLSCDWFQETPENNAVAPSQLSVWKSRLSAQDGEIWYATTPHWDGQEDNIAGFTFTYTRDGARHIWLAVTNPTFLRRGVMTVLFAKVEEKAKGQVVTINTYPNRFCNMPLFLESRKYENYEVDENGSHGPKYKYRKVC